MENNNFKIEINNSYITIGKSAGRRNEYKKLNIIEITEHTILYTVEDNPYKHRQGISEFNTEYKFLEQVHSGLNTYMGNYRATETHTQSPFIGRDDLVTIQVPEGARISIEESFHTLVWIVTG